MVGAPWWPSPNLLADLQAMTNGLLRTSGVKGIVKSVMGMSGGKSVGKRKSCTI